MSDLKIAISRYGPECPCCGGTGFDDWHLTPGLKRGVSIVAITGRLQCHSCGKFFHVDHYHDGETHCSVGGHRP